MSVFDPDLSATHRFTNVFMLHDNEGVDNTCKLFQQLMRFLTISLSPKCHVTKSGHVILNCQNGRKEVRLFFFLAFKAIERFFMNTNYI